MKNRLINGLLAILLLVFHLPLMAEDIDLFTGYLPTEKAVPNVLIIIDNTANWNQQMELEFKALASTIENLPPNSFRIGFMTSAETGNPNNNITGGYIRAAIRLMDTTNQTLYGNLARSFDGDDKGNGGEASLAMAEAYHYFSGGTPYSGNNKVFTDYQGNDLGIAKKDRNSTIASKAIYALGNNALEAFGGTKYNSPVTLGCQKNFIIYLSNNAPQDNRSEIVASETMLRNAGGSAAQISLSPSGSQDSVGDEWARFMYKSTLNVVTYVIDVDPVTTGQGPGWTRLLKSMADESEGDYFSVTSSTDGGAKIAEALGKIFSEIQSENSVFASVSLPVSVNTQGTYLNQVYVGMFRPDGNAFPRWHGNLKQYKMGLVSEQIKLLDANGDQAINSGSGFITECSRSYWTPATVDTYWDFPNDFDSTQTCLAVPNSGVSNYPDGNVVEKGAQAYETRNEASRTIYTCSPSSCTSLTVFNDTNVTQTMLGAADATEHQELIDWARGIDVDDENENGNTTTEIRSTVHGDIVHSRPVAINFGTNDAPKVVVFYGGNDGMLRAVNGNRSASIESVSAGDELWAFMPPEFYEHIKRNRDNNIKVNYLGSFAALELELADAKAADPYDPDAEAAAQAALDAVKASRQPKPYGMDGAVTAYMDDTSTWIFSGMRRGGRAYYAFDVSDPTASPSLKWRVGCPEQDNDTGCDAGFTDIGQTWSSLQVLKSEGYKNGEIYEPMVIAGGGYDTCEDDDPNSCSSGIKGSKIYVLDADNGTLLKALNTERSVVGDVLVVKNVETGLATHAYATDTGGNIYRVNMGTDAPADWTITHIADLGCDTTASCAANRKFMFRPDVLKLGDTYVLSIGSGDREKPVSGYASAKTVANHFFMIKDQPSNVEWLSSENSTCGADVICKNSLVELPADADTAPSGDDLAAKKGWYLNLQSTEQVVTSAITVYGVVTFSTHMPFDPDRSGEEVCEADLGKAFVYNINYADGATENNTDKRFEVVSGGGLPPSPIAGLVSLDDGETVPFIIGADPDSPLESKDPPVPSVGSQPKSKVYWYIEQ